VFGRVHNYLKSIPQYSLPGRGRCQDALIGFPKSIEELFGKRRNNEAIMAILFAKLPLSEVDFDETVEARVRVCVMA
jgi:hypothetical protein